MAELKHVDFEIRASEGDECTFAWLAHYDRLLQPQFRRQQLANTFLQIASTARSMLP